MRKVLIAAAAAVAMAAGAAHASTITDPVGDFVAGYAGPALADLDVISFTVNYNPATTSFLLSATMAGDIGAVSNTGLYIIGVNTGGAAAAPGPFNSLGAGNVIFNRTISLTKANVATLSGTTLTSAIHGATFDIAVPLSLLASTGFAPSQYGFNLWPRNGGSGLTAISDFSPGNGMLTAVPEPSTWAFLLAGFAAVGGLLRARRRPAGPAALRA